MLRELVQVWRLTPYQVLSRASCILVVQLPHCTIHLACFVSKHYYHSFAHVGQSRPYINKPTNDLLNDHVLAREERDDQNHYQ